MLIGALAQTTGVPAKTLRYWESEGLVSSPDRTAGGYRDYPGDTVDRVTFIRRAQAAGLTLRQISSILLIHDAGQPPCTHTADLVDERLADVDARLAELEQTRTALRTLRARLGRLDPAGCDAATICSAIDTTSP